MKILIWGTYKYLFLYCDEFLSIESRGHIMSFDIVIDPSIHHQMHTDLRKNVQLEKPCQHVCWYVHLSDLPKYIKNEIWWGLYLEAYDSHILFAGGSRKSTF